MIPTRAPLLAWLTLSVAATAGQAEVGGGVDAMEPAARSVVATLVTRKGETIRGEIVAANATGMAIRLDEPAPPRTVEWAALPAETVFRLWRQARGETDATRWVELAQLLRGMHDGESLSNSALEVAVLLDKGLSDEAEAVRRLPVPPPVAVTGDAGPATAWLGLGSLASSDTVVPPGPTWGDFPAARDAEFIAATRAYADDVAAKLGVTFTLVETTHFLYFTNVPPERTYHSPRLLDQMFDKACDLYGLPRGTKLFKGKCPIFMFEEQGQLQRFTQVFGGPEWAAGFCQQSTNGDVQIVMFQGQDRGYAIQTMLHETAHGVNWRYRAPKFLPPWLEEGIAEWVASNTTGDFKYVKSKRWSGLQKVRETRTLGPQFFTPPGDGSPSISEAWEYGIAYDLVDTLIEKDRAKFVAMVNAIKDGTPQEVAIAEQYGVTLDAFLTKYGEGVGIRGLTR